MTDLNTMMREATSDDKPEVLAVVTLAVDRHNNTTLSHEAGKTNLSASLAKNIDTNSVFALASATKLITAIALLRLLQANPKISLDDPDIVQNHLPELCSQVVLTSAPGQQPLTYESRKLGITLRQLLTHTSGSGTDMLDPRLIAWRKERGEPPSYLTAPLPEAIATPSLFQPGEGWAYGGGSDWIGIFISRVTNTPFGEYVRREISDIVGCDAFIGFHKHDIETQGGTVVQIVTKDHNGGGLNSFEPPEQKDERGGGGLYASAANYVKILHDLIAPESKLLDEKHVDLLFAPQLQEGSPALESFRAQSHIFKGMTGPLTSDLPSSSLNHALGGLLVTKDTSALGKTANTMAWGGAFGSVWFANREQGVAGFFGGSMFPPGFGKNVELAGEFVREVWRGVGKG